MVDIQRMRTEHFASNFVLQTVRLWNLLQASLFSDKYDVSKSRVNLLLLGKSEPSSTYGL